MKALLIIGGEKPSKQFFHQILPDFDILAVADGGLDYALQAGVTPTLVVGDMDSLKDPSVLENLNNAEIIRASRHKDNTDTELALEELKKRGFLKITLWGGGGGRLDHLFALRILFEQENPPTEWFTARAGIILVDRRIELGERLNRRVSLFPMENKVCQLKSKGLRRPLDDLVWDRTGFGISNQVVSPESYVEPAHGKAILIYDLDSEDRG